MRTKDRIISDLSAFSLIKTNIDVLYAAENKGAINMSAYTICGCGEREISAFTGLTQNISVNYQIKTYPYKPTSYMHIRAAITEKEKNPVYVSPFSLNRECYGT